MLIIQFALWLDATHAALAAAQEGDRAARAAESSSNGWQQTATDVAMNLDNLAACLSALGRYQEAMPKFEAALEMRQRLFAGDRLEVANSLNNVASCLNALGHSAEALPKDEAALAM